MHLPCHQPCPRQEGGVKVCVAEADPLDVAGKEGVVSQVERDGAIYVLDGPGTQHIVHLVMDDLSQYLSIGDCIGLSSVHA